MIVVADTGPLIGLAKLDKLFLLRDIAQRVLIPPLVHREILGKIGEETPHIDQALEDFIQVAPLPPRAPQVVEMVAHLDPGEQQALMLAHHLTALLLIDDQAGRQTAQRLGLRFTGLIGLLLRLKEMKKIDRIGPLLNTLRRRGYWLSDGIVAYALRLAGEH